MTTLVLLNFIFLCLLSIACGVVDTSKLFTDKDFNGSAIGTTNYRDELAVIALGKKDYLHAISVKKKRRHLLCVVFMKASVNNLVTVLSNMQRLGDACDWAVIFYAGEYKEEVKVCSHPKLKSRLVLCTRPRATLRVNDGVDVSNSKEHLSKSVPKTVLYRSLLPLLPNYERIFLLDEDISLVEFDYNIYSEVWDCAFRHQSPPLITQAVVAEDTQFFDFVSERSWRDKNIVATASGLVEQQAPLFDSIFFEWFVKRVLKSTYQYALEYGVDWGHDRSWCNAAAMYSVEVLGWAPGGAVCAIITGTSIHHLNTHAMVGKKTNKVYFRSQGNRVVQRYIDRYPTWVLLDILAQPSPLDAVYGHRYKKVETLDAQCVQRRKAAKQSNKEMMPIQ